MVQAVLRAPPPGAAENALGAAASIEVLGLLGNAQF